MTPTPSLILTLSAINLYIEIVHRQINCIKRSIILSILTSSILFKFVLYFMASKRIQCFIDVTSFF